MSGRRVIPYETYQSYYTKNTGRSVAMNRRRRHDRMKKRILMCLVFAVCCVICFLWGFQFRGSETIARADSQTLRDFEASSRTFSLGEAVADPSLPEPTGEERSKYYTSIELESGDSLYDIACEYMTEEYDSIDQYITELKQINGMVSNQLQQGDYLLVPYYA